MVGISKHSKGSKNSKKVSESNKTNMAKTAVFGNDKKNVSLLNHSSGRISSAKTVILQEAFGLQRLVDEFDTAKFQKSFIATLHEIDMAIAKNGKVVFTGMGKMSYVAHKIAATMASLGTPSIYIHAAESSHGDMGMICKGDVVVCLSNSGESKEIFDVIDYCKKFKITLIAMTRNADGKLAKNSNIVLLVPEVAEACPMGKAPTVSTTQFIALGDALSIVMSERIGMNPDKYKNFHPGGKLGSSVIPISDFYNPDNELIIIKESDTIEVVLVKLKNAKRPVNAAIAVVDKKGVLTGTLHAIDLLTGIGNSKYESMTAKDLMKKMFAVELNCPMFDASKLMNDNSLKFCFIIKKVKPIGVLYLADFAKIRN